MERFTRAFIGLFFNYTRGAVHADAVHKGDGCLATFQESFPVLIVARVILVTVLPILSSELCSLYCHCGSVPGLACVLWMPVRLGSLVLLREGPSLSSCTFTHQCRCPSPAWENQRIVMV